MANWVATCLTSTSLSIILAQAKFSPCCQSKVTLRKRIAQTGYWKVKLAADQATAHIKVYFITPDEDGTLTTKRPAKKGRAIVEVDTDGCYVLSETEVEESAKVKSFDKFIKDLNKLLKQ